MRYGLWDTRDGGWIGSNEQGTGPKVFDSLLLARVAEQMLGVQLGWHPGRLRARQFTEGAYHETQILETRCDSLAALKEIESGKL